MRFTTSLKLIVCVFVAASLLSGCRFAAPGASSAHKSAALLQPQPIVVPSPSTVPTASTAATSSAATDTVFAIIGDYGMDDSHEAAVAHLVATWKPAYVFAVGDDYYRPAGGTGTGKYDESTGKYYSAWLKDITTTGKNAPVGNAEVNAFFPALGNHDYSDATPSPATYLKYFALPGSGFTNTSGNERYYDFVEGPVHYFVLNSNPDEPDGTTASSKQAGWLKAQLKASTSTWNVVFDHHPPYSSDSTHGSSKNMRWPFASWGADVVVSGHAHVYERVLKNGIVYFTDGLGGAARYSFRKTPVSGSKRRYRANWGAMRAAVTSSTLTFDFYSVGGKHVDSYKITSP